MKLYIFACLVVIISEVQSQDDLELQIDEFIEEVMTCEDIPGLTLAVIRDGQDFISKGYGVSNIDTGDPVTNQTRFLINSVTKAFGGMSAAIAMKKTGGFTWTTPVRDILGDWFYLNDTLRTQQLTLIDTLSHRSGLAYNNEMRIAGYTPREFTERLQYLEFSSDFRHQFQYNNLMYNIPGIVVEDVTGQNWTEFVRENIFQPLGMETSGFIFDEGSFETIAQGYRPDIADEGQLRPVDPVLLRVYYESAPASGAIITNSQDMRQWLKFQLNKGTTEDEVEILTPEEFEETHRQHNHQTGDVKYTRPFYPVTYAPSSGYSLGWLETTYRDYILQEHYGSLVSFNSVVLLLPDVKHGIYMSMNKYNTGDARPLIGMFIMDLLLGEEPWLNVDNVCDILQPDSYKKADKGQSDLNKKDCRGQPDLNKKDCRGQSDLNKKIDKEQSDLNVKDAKLTSTKITKRSVKDIPNDNSQNSMNQTSELNKEERVKHKFLPDFLGSYGHYAYGNITIVEGSNTTYVMLFSRYNWTYDLQPTENDNSFLAIGREPIWYHIYGVLFDRLPEELATAITVSFDVEIPPRFERDLDWNNPPPPPVLCESLILK